MTEEPEQPPSPAAPVSTPEPSGQRGRAGLLAAGLILAAALGALLFLAGFLAAGGIAGQGGCAAPTEAFIPFCEAYTRITTDYVDDIPDDKLVEGAIRGLFEFGVGDPYSGYMTPEDYQNSLSDLSGTFTGIGAEMAVDNLENPGDLTACAELSDTCALVVVSPIAGAPAEKAGIKAGDRILAVDGVSVNGSTVQDQVAKVRGEAGTDVTLTIERDGQTSDITVTRDEIVVQQVTSRLIDGHIGYVALTGFSSTSADQVRAAIQSRLDDGADAFILDLRGNPGGYITAAQDIASEFVKSGLLFTQESNGGEVKKWEATGNGLVVDKNIPVVVLVDGGSASASEIVTAALKENNRATIIGEPTYGKNTVQVWSDLSNGGGVRITISRWFTPDHNSVHPDGVQPDIVVTVPDNTPAGEDPVLDRALEFLAGQTGMALRAAA
jgi:carboxyl-terminal processing protease